MEQTIQKQKQSQLRDLPLKAFCGVSALTATTLPALAVGKGKIDAKDYGDIFGDDYNSKAELNADSTKDTISSIYGLLKVALVLAGLFIFAGGVFQLIKAHKSQGQISPAAGWVMIFGGAVLSVAGAIFFALGGGIKGSLVAGK